MTGHPVDLASAISSALRQCVLATNPKHKLLFPHLISDLFRAFRVPEHPADLTFPPASPFVYVRLGQPRAIPPPPPAQPASSSSPSPPPSPPAPSSAPPVLPPVSSPPPISTPVSSPPSAPPAPSEVALLRQDVLDLRPAIYFEAHMTADHEFTRSILTMIAAHLGLPIRLRL
ncbi:hypothetical protein K2173_015516 [Erythroxylum novogranatense]|uniref:Uncharacterized protein n=1 Tax=Erythroxylum novogranatense TaxID=1862640 RepID=A0AAV8SSS2_9ROSI|nr:hypothetical protein K2173_015516 [Erythroxylum novogranatense]